MRMNTFSAIAISLAPLHAWAHEGHGVPGQGNSVSHYALDPLHLPLCILAFAAAVWFVSKWRLSWSSARSAKRQG